MPFRRIDDAALPARIGYEHRREVARLIAERDNALATLGTMSDRLRAETDRADRLRSQLDRERTQRRPLAVPVAELYSSLENLDMKDPAVVEVVVDVVEKRVGVTLAEDTGQRRVWCELFPLGTAIYPEVDDSCSDLGPAGPSEHEADCGEVAHQERHVHVRLVPQEDAAVSHDDEASVSGHEDPLPSSNDQATPTDGEVA